MANRGQVTPAIEDLSFNLMGYVIPRLELDMMAFITPHMISGSPIKIESLDFAGIEILYKWKSRGYILGSIDANIAFTKDFWFIMQGLIWLSEIDFKNQDAKRSVG